MNVPITITLRKIDPSPALEARLRTAVLRLTRITPDLTSVHIVVEQPHLRHQKGNLFKVSVGVTLPGAEIVATHTQADDPAHANVYLAVRDAMRAMRRALRDTVRIRRRDVKPHAHALP